jgi:survival of motor neuron-related-splicing factor 30
LNDPGNEELQNLKTELEEVIALTESAIAELKPAAAPVPSKKASPPPVREKWSKENHPAYQAGYRKAEPEPPTEEPQIPVAFNVNDTVSARWKTGDGSFYPARITSITGSTSKPVYIVTFKNYATTETLSAKDIKPISGDSKKRKADGMPGASSLPTPPPNPNVISAAANVDPALASQARQEPSKVSDGPPRPAKVPRKVKAGKELEAGKSKWQDFTTKGKMGKVAKKESMFRTPEGFNARGMMVQPVSAPSDMLTTSHSGLYGFRATNAKRSYKISAHLQPGQ